MATSTSVDVKMGEVSLNGNTRYERTPFGKEMLKHFLFDPAYKNLNHGSFGAFPRVIRDKQREYQELCESAQDPFIRYIYPKLLDESREAVAKLLNADTETVVFVPNATTGINTALRNIEWHEDGKDEILYFSTIYGACGKTIEYVCEANRYLVKPREIPLNYPLSDVALAGAFKDAIRNCRLDRKFPRVAVFDTVSSLPGVRMPFEALIAICKAEGILSLIDGAHGLGHISLDLTTLDPDFFVSNAHKWLFVPRACAVFYVPVRNQHLMRSSLPTSHSFQPRSAKTLRNPLPPSSKSEFVNLFEFTGSLDHSNYICVPEAIKWRQEACGGEEAIAEYCSNLAREGGKLVAEMLGTKILENDERTLTNCSLINILLPLTVSTEEGPYSIHPDNVGVSIQWMQEKLIEEFKTFLPIYFFQGQWWARLSGQVYLDLNDFEWAGHTLKAICDKAGKGEFLKEGKTLDDKGETVVGGDLAKDGIDAVA